MSSAGPAPTMTETAGQRGLRVVAVVDQTVAPRLAAVLLGGRLLDELPPEWVRVISVGQPVWERALGLESAMAACIEPGGVVWPEVYDGPSGPSAPPDIVEALADAGLAVTASWSPLGWRSTLRRAAMAEIGSDLVLALSTRRRPLPCGLRRQHHVELLAPPRR